MSYKLKIEIVGTKKQLAVMVSFLKKLDYLGNTGSTDTIHLWCDGDGARRIKVIFPEIKKDIPIKSSNEFYID